MHHFRMQACDYIDIMIIIIIITKIIIIVPFCIQPQHLFWNLLEVLTSCSVFIHFVAYYCLLVSRFVFALLVCPELDANRLWRCTRKERECTRLPPKNPWTPSGVSMLMTSVWRYHWASPCREMSLSAFITSELYLSLERLAWWDAQ